MEKIYNRPLRNSNDFLISQSEGSTDWVSYHLIPKRVKVDVEIKFSNGFDSDKNILEVITVMFDYPVDEKSERSFLKKGVEVLKGKYTQKILSLKIKCNKEFNDNNLNEIVGNIFRGISLDILKESNQLKDEVLRTSYKAIAKIIVHISEDLSKERLPEFTNSFE